MSSQARDFYRRTAQELDYTSGGKRPQFNPGLALVMRELAEYVPFNAVDKRDRTAVAICSVNMLCRTTGYQERNMEQALKTLEEKGLIKRLPEYGSGIARRGPNGELYSPVNGYFLVDYAAEIGHELTQAEIDRASALLERNRDRGRKRNGGSNPPSQATGGSDHPSETRGQSKTIQGSAPERSRDHPEGKGKVKTLDSTNVESNTEGKKAHSFKDWGSKEPTPDTTPPSGVVESEGSSGGGAVAMTDEEELALREGVELSGKCDTKAKKAVRDAIFWAWAAHLKERWDREPAYQADRPAAWNLAKKGVLSSEVIAMYDHFMEEGLGRSMHLHLNVCVKHLSAWRNQTDTGVQANGRHVDAAEMKRVEGGEVDPTVEAELSALFGGSGHD